VPEGHPSLCDRLEGRLKVLLAHQRHRPRDRLVALSRSPVRLSAPSRRRPRDWAQLTLKPLRHCFRPTGLRGILLRQLDERLVDPGLQNFQELRLVGTGPSLLALIRLLCIGEEGVRLSRLAGAQRLCRPEQDLVSAGSTGNLVSGTGHRPPGPLRDSRHATLLDKQPRHDGQVQQQSHLFISHVRCGEEHADKDERQQMLPLGHV